MFSLSNFRTKRKIFCFQFTNIVCSSSQLQDRLMQGYSTCSVISCGQRQISKFRSSPAVNFINDKRANFSYEHCFGSFFSSYVYIVKAAKTMFVQKMCAKNVDEIDTRSTNYVEVKFQQIVISDKN